MFSPGRYGIDFGNRIRSGKVRQRVCGNWAAAASTLGMGVVQLPSIHCQLWPNPAADPLAWLLGWPPLPLLLSRLACKCRDLVEPSFDRSSFPPYLRHSTGHGMAWHGNIAWPLMPPPVFPFLVDSHPFSSGVLYHLHISRFHRRKKESKKETLSPGSKSHAEAFQVSGAGATPCQPLSSPKEEKPGRRRKTHDVTLHRNLTEREPR